MLTTGKLRFFLAVLLFTTSSLFADEPKQTATTTDATSQEAPKKEHVQNSWDKVSALYLPSLVSKENKQKMLTNLSTSLKERSNQGPVNQDDFLKQMQELKKIKESDELQKALTPDTSDYIKQVLAHLAGTEDSTVCLHEDATVVFDDTTYRDLNVFCGKEETPAISLFNLVDLTQTIAGRAALLNILYNPLADIQALRARQAIIKKLVSDEQLFASIEQKLATIKQAENTLFVLLNEIHFDLISKITDRFYLKSVFDLPVVSFILSFPIINSIRLLDLFPPMKKFNAFACDKLNKKKSLLEFKHLNDYFNELVAIPVGLVGFAGIFGAWSYFSAQRNEYGLAVRFGILAAAIAGFTPYIVKEIYKTAADKLKSENMLHDAISALAKMTIDLKELQKLVASHQELADIVPFKDFEKDATIEFKSLLSLLEDENFKKPATWKTHKGKMMAALKFLCTLKYELIPPYLDAGKLDALMSTATLYKKYATHPNARYHFATYEEQLAPHLKLNDFWNPFINPDIVVTNFIELGTSKAHRNMLITGPNQGGKSTALKALAFAVLLAQTLTIANADVTLTPLSKVFTTLNITDTTGKESLYQADKNRVKHVTLTLAGLAPSEKALLISDEMFNSTAATFGSALFYGTLNYIDGSLKNALFAAATHFEQLIELEKDTRGSVANFRVEEAMLGNDGKLTWTYKIKPGINRQNIAFELAQEDGFDQRILTAGKKLLQRHAPSTLMIPAAA